MSGVFQVYVTAICKTVLLQCQRKGTEILELEIGNWMRLVASSVMVLENRPGGTYQHQGSVWSMGNMMQKAFESLHCHQVTVKSTGEVHSLPLMARPNMKWQAAASALQIEKQGHFCPIIPPQTKRKHPRGMLGLLVLNQ